MPGMDGLTATRTLRDRERTAQRQRVPVVACTASVTQDDRADCEAADMDDYVSKPLGREALDAVLRRWLGPPVA
jgi:CheY-like chemotaxis protein